MYMNMTCSGLQFERGLGGCALQRLRRRNFLKLYMQICTFWRFLASLVIFRKGESGRGWYFICIAGRSSPCPQDRRLSPLLSSIHQCNWQPVVHARLFTVYHQSKNAYNLQIFVHNSGNNTILQFHGDYEPRDRGYFCTEVKFIRAILGRERERGLYSGLKSSSGQPGLSGGNCILCSCQWFIAVGRVRALGRCHGVVRRCTGCHGSRWRHCITHPRLYLHHRRRLCT